MEQTIKNLINEIKSDIEDKKSAIEFLKNFNKRETITHKDWMYLCDILNKIDIKDDKKDEFLTQIILKIFPKAENIHKDFNTMVFCIDNFDIVLSINTSDIYIKTFPQKPEKPQILVSTGHDYHVAKYNSYFDLQNQERLENKNNWYPLAKIRTNKNLPKTLMYLYTKIFESKKSIYEWENNARVFLCKLNKDKIIAKSDYKCDIAHYYNICNNYNNVATMINNFTGTNTVKLIKN